jgi:hypothetical protein
MTENTPQDPWATPPAGSTPQPPTPQQPGVPPTPQQPGVPPVPPPPAVPGGGGYYGNPPGYAAPPSYGAPMGGPPPNNLVWAILATILCCVPLGIVSIVYSAQVNSKWAVGDVAGAYASAKKAKSWAIWAAVLGVVGSILSLIFFVVVAANVDPATTYNT